MSLSARYEALVPLMDREVASVKAMVENCHRAREAGEEPERPGPRGRGGAAGAAILGAILGGIPFGEFAGAASGSQGRERFGE